MSALPPPPPPTRPGPSVPPPYHPPAPPRRRSPWPIVAAVVAAFLVLAVALTGSWFLLDRNRDDAGSATGAEAAAQGSAEPEGGSDTPVGEDLDEVRVYEDLDKDHREGDITYPQSPPVGGPHHAVWLDCGVYDVPVRNENMVHSLEHGTVWITYRPDAVTADDIAALTGKLPDNGILSPYPDQIPPVAITVWGRQLDLVGSSDPRIELFIAEFGHGATAPEPFASCHGGHPDPEGPGSG